MSGAMTPADVKPGDTLRLVFGGEMVLANVACTCGGGVKTVTAFAPGLACVCDMRWSGGKLASGRGVQFDVSRMPRRIGR